jgi:predicted ester cyclase
MSSAKVSGGRIAVQAPNAEGAIIPIQTRARRFGSPHGGRAGGTDSISERLFLATEALSKESAIVVMKTDLSDIYRDYIACLNRQDWPKLGQFVDDDVIHNGRRVGLSGYLKMLERDFDEIPDLSFNIQMLIADPPHIASRLGFDCTPKATFLGLDVSGRRISFAENVFYAFRADKIREVWSVIDKAAIEAQL